VASGQSDRIAGSKMNAHGSRGGAAGQRGRQDAHDHAAHGDLPVTGPTLAEAIVLADNIG
jgi:hypothetical protein